MINDNIFLIYILSLFISLIIDLTYGELPTSIHPVVLYGKIIDYYKNILIKFKNKINSFILYILVVTSSIIILYIILKIAQFNNIIFFIIYSIILSSTFSINLLISSAKDIENKLKTNIEAARKSVSYLVSRNTNNLSKNFIVSATIETLSENITDSYVSPIFYYTIFAIILSFTNNYQPIILLFVPVIYRISNTLDAMVGYKNDELKYIGYTSAKIDDILNYIPSRLTGLLIVLSSFILNFNYKNAYLMYKRDARKCPSPNSGYTMATIAGALNIKLVKKDTYSLGDSKKEIEINDISNAIKISKLTIFLFTLIMIILVIVI